MSPTSYGIRADAVARRLATAAAVLLVLHVISIQILYNGSLGLTNRFAYWQLSVFDLDQEAGFGTWFSAGMLLVAGILLLHQAKVLHRQGSAEERWWYYLGIGFCLLSMDEVAGIHEALNTALDGTDIAWTTFGLMALVLVAVAYVPFLWQHRRRLGPLFLLAGAVYGAGAVGVEHSTDADVESLHYNMWTTLEEGMEMSGVIIFIYAVLDHLGGAPGQVIRVEVGLDE